MLGGTFILDPVSMAVVAAGLVLLGVLDLLRRRRPR